MSDFITKDSGQRHQFVTGSQRDTEEGKPDYTNKSYDDLLALVTAKLGVDEELAFVNPKAPVGIEEKVEYIPDQVVSLVKWRWDEVDKYCGRIHRLKTALLGHLILALTPRTLGMAVVIAARLLEHEEAMAYTTGSWVSRVEGLLERGAVKYSKDNWMLGQPMSRVRRSGLRHYIQWIEGEKDEDHLAAVFFNLMCAYWFTLYRERYPDELFEE